MNWSSTAFLELWEKGESYLATSSMVAGIGLSFVSARKHIDIYSIYIEHRQRSCFYLRVRYMVSPGRINVMSPEVMAMDPKMRVGMIGLISASAATVVDRVPPTLNEKKTWIACSMMTQWAVIIPGNNFCSESPLRPVMRTLWAVTEELKQLMPLC